MQAIDQLHGLADTCRQQCGFYVSVSTAYHASGGEYFSAMIFDKGSEIAHLYGTSAAEVADKLATFIVAHRKEAA
ncbi:MAG: hypothetical protein ACQEW0_16320 [Pseudomonadota bacterium]